MREQVQSAEEPISSRLWVFALWALSLLQGALFLTDGSSANRIAGLTLTVLTTLLASRRGRWRLPGIATLTVVGFANFVLHAIGSSTPPAFPLLFAAVLYGYGSFGLVSAARLLLRRDNGGLVLSALSLWMALVFAHLCLGRLVPVEPSTGDGAVWMGGTVPHPILGEYYAPNTVARTIYPSNPRGYFKETAPGERDWEVLTNDAGSRARVSQTGGDESVRRVEIDEARVPTVWNVQLARLGLCVRKGERYGVRFSVRAARPRAISFGVSQAHPPWEGMGFYRSLSIGMEWQTFSEAFTASGTDDRARVHFDLGAVAVPVEIKDVAVQRIETGESALRSLPAQFYVEYRFNSRGCRGPEYPVPAPPGRLRVLALGDSFTLGVGVHQEDTVTAQLERLLNGDATTRQSALSYDVVNCGVSGYGTHEERLMYELQAPTYRPDVVLLMMVFNDQRSWLTDIREGYVHRPSTFERSFLPWARIQSYRSQRRMPPLDYSENVKEILRLDAEVRKTGARLAVMAFRHITQPEGEWTALVRTVSAGLAGSDVPWLDLGQTLIPGHRVEEMIVHPIDGHPNEVAHKLAAQSIFQFLREQGLIK
jgi:lysophospholipase L1-like esterase